MVIFASRRANQIACVMGAVLLVGTASPRRVMAQDEAAVAAPKAEKPFALMSRMVLGRTDSVAMVAREQVGLRYRYGASQPGKAFDCSALVKHVLSYFNVELPRTAHEQATVGIEVPKDKSQLEVGDLLYFGRGKRVQHVGIYVGDGRYVHAANRRKGVIESTLPDNGSRRAGWWKGVRRLLHLPDSTGGSAVTDATTSGPQMVPAPVVVGGGDR